MVRYGIQQGAEIGGPILHIDDHPPTGWDDFAAANSPLLFYRSKWSAVLSKGFDAQILYCYTADNGVIIGGLPAQVYKLGLVRMLYSLLPYGGPLGDIDDSFWEALSLRLKKEFNIHRIQIVSPVAADIKGFKKIEGIRHRLNLNNLDKEKLWVGYKKGVRRNIRLAQKKGVEVLEAVEREHVDSFFELYRRSMARNKALARYPLNYFRSIFKLLGNERSDLFMARHDGIFIAGIYVVYSDDEAHYLMGGSDYSSRDLFANDLLFHTAIERSLDRNLEKFDFMGSPKHDEELMRYKSKWGSDSEEADTFVLDLSPIRTRAWDLLYGLAKTKIGAGIVNRMRG